MSKMYTYCVYRFTSIAYNRSMNMFSKNMKAKAASAAYGSVRAEGLSPSVKTKRQVEKYVQGKITKEDLRRGVVREVRQKNK